MAQFLQNQLCATRRRIVTKKLVANHVIVNKLDWQQNPDNKTWDIPVALQQVIQKKKSSTAVWLKNDDFKNGTYRIRNPGTYMLSEDIIFNPNPDDDWLPRHNQSEMYPPEKYKLGFFAAITIECANVILDGNGFCIRQSRAHYLQQRFFACIETADQPFIPHQGPDPMGNTIRCCESTKIQNINLGLSSHHGIHGNNNTNLVLLDITISQFEIAGLSLNGSVNTYIENVTISDSSKQVPVLATYSHARFLAPFFSKLDLTKTIKLRGVEISGEEIASRLNLAMTNAFEQYIQTGKVMEPIFANEAQIADGNQYGIVLNHTGVAVNDLPTTRGKRNTKIYVKNVTISNIKGAYHEIPAIPTEQSGSAYRKVESTVIGAVFRYNSVKDSDGYYIGDALSDAEIYLSTFGFGTISDKTIAWAENGNTILDLPYGLVGNGDSMAHISKSTIGLLISGGKDINLNNVHISNIVNKGTASVLEQFPGSFKGSSTVGITAAASELLVFNHVTIDGIYSDEGRAIGVYQYYTPHIRHMSSIITNLSGGIVKNRPSSNPDTIGIRQLTVSA